METPLLYVSVMLALDCLGNKKARLACPDKLCPFLKIFGDLNTLKFTFTSINSFIMGLICAPRTAFLSGVGCYLGKIGLRINTDFWIFMGGIGGVCTIFVVCTVLFGLYLGA